MNFVPVQVYTNYIDAHIARGQLEEEGISCWLKDEQLVSTTPIWTQAVGGIKLMVAEEDVAKTKELLQLLDVERHQNMICPSCGSNNVEYVTTPRKASTWLGVLFGGLFFNYGLPSDKVYHCFDCEHEFAKPKDGV